MPVVQDATWDELSARLRSFVSRRVSDATVRDDLAQEILLRLHRSLPSLRRTQLHAALSLCCPVELDAADQIGEVERRGPCACKDQSASTG